MPGTASPVVSESLAGRTLRWKFGDGPTAGKVYEHTFRSDGTVVFREVSGEAEAKSRKPSNGTAAPKYASFEIAPETHLVSYLSESGYTLTVAVNLQTHECRGIASNEKEWYPLTGEVKEVD
jgi:hypothetical protein